MVGGWTKTKLMLFSTQVEVVVELKLELSLAIVKIAAHYRHASQPPERRPTEMPTTFGGGTRVDLLIHGWGSKDGG